MPQKKPLLGRIGKAVQQGADIANKYQRARKLKELFDTSDDPVLGELGTLVDPMTGELSRTGGDLLSNEMAQRRAEAQANAQAQAIMARMQYEEGIRQDKELVEGRKEAIDKLFPTFKMDVKQGEPVYDKLGALYSSGVNPEFITPEQRQRITDYYARTGRIPSLVGTKESGSKVQRKVKGKGLSGIFGGMDFNPRTPGMFDQTYEEPILEYEFQY